MRKVRIMYLVSVLKINSEVKEYILQSLNFVFILDFIKTFFV